MKVNFYIILTVSLLKLVYLQQEKELLEKVITAKLAELPQMQNIIDNFFPPVKERNNFIQGRGFEKFKQSTDIVKYLGVPHDKLKDFLAFLMDAFNMPKELREAYIGKLYLTRFAKLQNLIVNDLVFNIGGGEGKYVTIIGITNRDTKTTDWLVADVKVGFELSPDIAILHSSSSSLFGLFSESSTTYVKVPKSLTQDQINAVTSYFQIVTFEGFKSVLNMKTLVFIEKGEEILNFLQ